MKKHSLIDHWDDVSMWWHDVNHENHFGASAQEQQMIFFVAYERWMNDRELLTVEDEYEFTWETVPAGDARLGSISRRSRATQLRAD